MPKNRNGLQLVGHSSKTVLREPRTDGWKNLVTLLGTSADKRTGARINWEVRDPEFFEQLYSGGGIPARIVDLVPEESLREWIDWIDLEEGIRENEIEERCEELDVRGILLKTWKWARAYGGACLHIVTDTSDPASPLRYGERVIGLRDLSRWDVRVLTTDIEYDFGSPNWGHPRIYYLNVQMGSQYKGYPIHWTRMIRFDGQLVPRRTYIRNSYWHDSILNRLYDTIRDYQISNDAAAACLQDFNVDVFKMKNLAQLVAAGKEGIVKNRIELLNYAKSVLNAMILDADDEEYENKGRSMEGVAELLTHQANRLVAETDIPHTKLLGESPDGSNATGNSTSQQWYNFISAEQKNYLKPKMKRLFNILFPELQKKKQLKWQFKSLRVLDDVEKADVRNKQSQTDRNYIETGVLDPSEVAQSRFGGHEYSIETDLDDELREQGLIGSQEQDDLFPENENAQETGKEKKTKPYSTTGDQPPEGKTEKKEPSEPEPTAPKVEKKKKADEEGVSEFDPRNTVITPKNSIPKTQAFISQMMSEPMRDPEIPQIKGPGIPNKPREVMPTIGTGVMAPSGGSEKKDAEPKRAATLIVKKKDQFLMGKRRDTGRWTLPGGMIEARESAHQGGVRELAEETGILAKKLKFMGTRLVEPKMGMPVEVTMYQHEASDDFKPSNKKDPDQEIAEWMWLPIKGPLPEEILGNLQHPNNVALAHLGLLK